jgi:hypothetical protein
MIIGMIMVLVVVGILQMQSFTVFIKCPDMFDVDCTIQSDVI